MAEIDVAAAPGRRARKKERTRHEIYHTAMELFAQRDYDGVTVEDICAGADVAKATFFAHFENKAALIQAFHEELTEEISGALASHKGTAEAALEIIIRHLAAAGQSNGPVLKKMYREFMAQPELHSKAQDANRSLIQLVVAFIEKGQAAGEFRADVPAGLAAVSLLATWGSVTASWVESVESDPREDYFAVFDLLLRGIRQR
ncbi:MAG: TetR/AcrR family transcriptional regulator [Parvibaculaceae bacterium]|nr:TetR/AcrR family transcriptional regulator [Parvibaculaceae bacterium]